MTFPFVHEPSFWWALGLVIGTPVVLLILSELLIRLGRRQHPMMGPLKSARHLLLPATALYLLVTQVAEVDRDTVAVRLLLTMLAISVINTVLSLFNVLVFVQAAETSWQARTPKLVRELARVGLVLLGSGLALSSVWNFNLGSFLAALGVGSVVLGLALQEPLGNLFSGLMLTFERPFSIGDWIRVGETIGEVVEVNWRAVHILTSNKELQIIPNSSLAKNSFTNFSRPSAIVAENLDVEVNSQEAPNRIKEMLRKILKGTPGVLQDPAPGAWMVRYHPTASAVQYRLSYHVGAYGEAYRVRDELLTRIWYAGQRAGIVAVKASEAEGSVSRLNELLRPFAPFGLEDYVLGGDREGRYALKRYARGERVMAEGEPFAGLHLVLTGEAVLTVQDQTGQEQIITKVTRGDFFGEKSLLCCQASDVTVTASSDLEVLVLDSDQLHALLERKPRLAREIGQVMEVRRQAAQRYRGTRGLLRTAS